jgi:surfactin synthase thioesterase subunit
MSGKDPADLRFRRFRSSGGRVLMVCLPGAGGSADSFGAFADALAPAVEVLAIQYPVRWDSVRESALENLAERADCVVEELRTVLDRPVVLFGQGMGAVLAFEMARRLETTYGIDPVALFAVGSRAPSRLRNEGMRLMDDAAALADHRAVELYECGGQVAVRAPIVALGGDADARDAPTDVLAWRAHTTGRFQVTILPGGPMVVEDHFAEVADRVTDFLFPLLGGEVIDISRRLGSSGPDA